MTEPEPDRFNGLRWRLRATRRLWRPGAKPSEHFLPPLPIPEPSSGHLDHPAPGFEFDEGTVGFTGWAAFADGSPVARVEGEVDGIPIGRARTSLPRHDVDEDKNLPLGLPSGFEMVTAVTDLPADQRRGAKEIRVVATSVGGERLELGPIPVLLREDVAARTSPAALDTPPPPPEAAPLPPGSPPRTIVFTHQLTLGGAQLYLLDLLRELRRRDFEITVVSIMDGPLRDELDQIGINVHLTSMAPAEGIDAHIGRIAELRTWAAEGGFQVALINTATSAAALGAEVAAVLGVPSVWAIHESFPAALLWSDLEPEVRDRVEHTIAQASAAVFEADATREMYAELIPPERSVTVPYGVDPTPIERERARIDTAAARRKAGIAADDKVVLCVGTVEPRKAQLALAQAFSLIATKHPSARLVFVGARKKDPYTKDLETLVEALDAGDRIDLIPVTPEVQTWYGIADILVCASDVESLPRTVLEAMLWELPVVATDVFGLPELIDDGETGWLFESRDLRAMADGLDRALSASDEERHRIATAARRLVEERHSVPHYGEAIEKLLRDSAEDA
jgi:glycosyltransferase involved in cell wall biosynthesis